MKNRKNNWIKIVIQLLSFILTPELFVTGFTAIGDIFSQIYAGSISWESVRYSVYVLIATVPGSVLVGRFFCGFFCSFGAVHNIINLRKKWKGICSQVPFIVLKYRQGCIWLNLIKQDFKSFLHYYLIRKLQNMRDRMENMLFRESEKCP